MIRSEEVRYTADDLPMRSEIFWDDAVSGKRPGVTVFPEIFGLAEHALGRARQLAELGYIAIAADIHGDREVMQDLAEVQSRMAAVRSNVARVRARTQGAFDALLRRPETDPARVAAIGYCFGGTMAFELARGGAPIVAAVGFHSGLATPAPQDAGNIKGKILACIGADDPGIPPEQRAAFEEEMRAANVDWQLHLYGGVVHSFTNPEADKLGRPEFARYDARADVRSWASMKALFDEVFA